MKSRRHQRRRQSMVPATTSGTGAATADASILNALKPHSAATAVPATYAGQPWTFTQITVLAPRVTRAILAPFGGIPSHC